MTIIVIISNDCCDCDDDGDHDDYCSLRYTHPLMIIIVIMIRSFDNFDDDIHAGNVHILLITMHCNIMVMDDALIQKCHWSEEKTDGEEKECVAEKLWYRWVDAAILKKKIHLGIAQKLHPPFGQVGRLFSDVKKSMFCAHGRTKYGWW